MIMTELLYNKDFQFFIEKKVFERTWNSFKKEIQSFKKLSNSEEFFEIIDIRITFFKGITKATLEVIILDLN